MQLSLKYADTRYSFLASEGTRNTHPAGRVKFADLSEYGYGVAILSESKYGFSCQGNILRISLLRAATAPDAEQDQGSSCVPPLYLGTIMELG
jgi:alpha-mannosidase